MDEQEIIKLGIVGMSFKGDYDSEIRYKKLNVVKYNGSSYCAKGDTVGNLPTNSDYWDLLAEKGGTGPQGPKPEKGVDYYTQEDVSEIENSLKPIIEQDVQDEVVSQVGSLSSGTPLHADSISDMVDTTRLYVNTTNGYVYYYNGTDWVQGWVYQSSGIGTGTINIDSLDNTLKSMLIDTETTNTKIIPPVSVVTSTYINSNGTIVTNASRGYQMVVKLNKPCLRGTQISITDTNSEFQFRVGEYSSNEMGQATLLNSPTTMDTTDTYTVQNDNAYLAIGLYYIDTTKDCNRQNWKLINFQFKTSKTKNLEEQVKKNTNILFYTKTYTSENTDFNWGMGYVNTINGSIQSSEKSVATKNFVFLPKGTKIYIADGFKYILAMFSSDNLSSLISIIASNNGQTPYEIPSDCYVHISIKHIIEQVETIDIVENLTIIGEVARNFTPEEKYSMSPYYVNMEKYFVEDWYEGQNQDYSLEGFSSNTKYSEVIAKYEALRALDGDYLKRNILGVGSGLDENDNAYIIYEYVLKPKQYTMSWDDRKIPKILIQQAIQGFEKCQVFGMYYLVKDLINNYDKNPVLNFIRNHVEIHFIPVVDAWGFDRNLYYNANGVSLNRNFDVPNWEVTGSPDDPNQYSGPSPFSEPETQVVKTWLEANKENAILFIDNHTNGRYSVSNYTSVNWIAITTIADDYYKLISRAIRQHYQNITNNFIKEYNLENVGENVLGNMTTSAPTLTRGVAQRWGSAMEDIISITFEGFQGFPTRSSFQPEVFKANSELLGNFIKTFIKIYSEV